MAKIMSFERDHTKIMAKIIASRLDPHEDNGEDNELRKSRRKDNTKIMLSDLPPVKFSTQRT